MQFLQLILALCLIFSFNQATANTVEPPSKISVVTVFSQGAMVSRTVELDDLSGKQKLILKGLPLDIDQKSVIIEASTNIEIISVKTKKEFIEKMDSLAILIKAINVNIPIYQDSLNFYNSLIQVLRTERTLINQHRNFQDDKGTTRVDELIKASQFYRQRVKEIELEMLHKQRHSNEWKQLILDANNEIASLQNEMSKKETHIILDLDINPKSKQKLIIKYYTPNASWYPYYDLKVDKLVDGFQLHRKAFVNQNTGEDWDEVQLTLSDANPKIQNRMPRLSPYVLSKSDRYSYQNFSDKPATGVVLDYNGEPLIGANIIIKNSRHGTVTDLTGHFDLDNAIGKNAIISYIGFNTKEVLLKSGKNIIQLEEGNFLDEVIESGQEKRYDFYVDGIRTGQVKREKNKAAPERKALKQTKLDAIASVEYKIKMPYSIPSNTEEIDVLLETNVVPCAFEYHSVPLKSSQAFLTALISDWHSLDLLDGSVNLFLNNTYKGTSFINAQSLEDTLNISIGVDPEIIVERERKKDLSSKKFLSKKIEEELVYEIVVRNNKSQVVTVKILDQIPVSMNDDIDVKLLESNDASLDEERGFLSWKLIIPPGESQTKRLSYVVKYPNDYNVEL